MTDEQKELFLRGIEEFNNRDFFEAHDTWEEVWDEITGETRKFYQGLIHLAVGFYHLTVNVNPKGGFSQLEKGTEKLTPYGDSFLGVELNELLGKVQTWQDFAEKWLEQGNNEGIKIDFKTIPKIRFTETN